jgi:erythromycin esterase
MFIRTFLLAFPVVLLWPISPLWEQPVSPAVMAVGTKKKIEYLKERAVRLKTRKVTKKKFKDLEPLKAMIGDARIVLLGEQSLGHGTTMEMKGRLIRFLHEEMGFNILAWEANLQCCREIDRAFLESDEPIATILDKGVWAALAWAEQNRPLFEYIRGIRDGANPLILTGFDFQFSGVYASDCFVDSVDKFFNSAQPDLLPAAKILELKSLFDLFNHGFAESQEVQDAIKQTDYLLALLSDNRNLLEQHYTELETTMEYRILLNTKRFIQWYDYDRVQKIDDSNEPFERNKVMADTISFLAKKYYPDDKIIVWSSSYQILRNKHKISQNGNFILSGLPIMGEYLAEEFGEDIYSIGFIAYAGESQYANGYAHNVIRPAMKDTLSWYFYKLGGKYYFLDMKSLEQDSWIRDNMPERTLFPTSYFYAPWPEVFDAFVYIKKTTPCSMLLTP